MGEQPAYFPSRPAGQRLMSLDALRGFDMFWIVGADALVRGLRNMRDTPFTQTLADQLEQRIGLGFGFTI